MATGFYNMWCSMSEAFKQELWPYVKTGQPAVTFPDINNIDDRTAEFFRNIHDEGTLERLFKDWNAAGRTYKMWSFYATKPDSTQVIKSDIEMLEASYPQDFSGIGAWSFDDGSEVGAAQGEVWFPVPPQTVNFMPDVVTDPGDPDADPPVPPTYEPATEPTDVNLLFGQAPRDFNSFYNPPSSSATSIGIDVDGDGDVDVTISRNPDGSIDVDIDPS